MQTNLLALDERMADLIHDWHIAVGTSVDGGEVLCDAAGREAWRSAASAR